MELNEYQEKAMETCMPSCKNVEYMGFNLCAEVGELLGKIAKDIRKSEVAMSEDGIVIFGDQEQLINAIKLEAGDVLWQLAGLLYVLDIPLEEIAKMNLTKLSDRQKRGVIVGDGDYR